MFSFLSAFLIALVISGGLIGIARKVPHLLDLDTQGVQKMHTTPVPRVGGLAIYAAALLGGWAVEWKSPAVSHQMLLLLLCTLPATAMGVLEDFTKNISPRWRMLGSAISFFLAFALLDLHINRLNIPFLDPYLLSFYAIPSIIISLFAIATITNAINIIDGYNGLAGVVSILIILGIVLVAYQVGDSFILSSGLVIIGATAGFLVWNFPYGKIFLGDGGAYFMGSVIGMLAILLVANNPSVSAWFALLVLAYPLFEVAFSIYRKAIIRGTSPSQPDALHLHQLIFKRIAPSSSKFRNAYTSPFLWVLASLAVIPAVLFYQHSWVLAAFFLLFCLSYIFIYIAIIKWRTPKIIGKISQRQPSRK